VIKYDESKQQLTIRRINGGLAHAHRFGPGGGDRGTITAKKIIYNRLADTVNIEGAVLATGR